VFVFPLSLLLLQLFELSLVSLVCIVSFCLQFINFLLMYNNLVLVFVVNCNDIEIILELDASLLILTLVQQVLKVSYLSILSLLQVVDGFIVLLLCLFKFNEHFVNSLLELVSLLVAMVESIDCVEEFLFL